MEEHTNTIEILLERTAEFGKTTLELEKLKAVDKVSDVVSSLIPHSVAVGLMILFLLFLNLGIAMWIGEILERMYYGFFIVAGFYGLTGILVHFAMHNRLKKCVRNNFIQLLLK